MTTQASTAVAISHHNALRESTGRLCPHCGTELTSAGSHPRGAGRRSVRCRWLNYKARSARRQSAGARFLQWLESPGGQRVLREVLLRATRLREQGVKRYGIRPLFEAIRYDALTQWGQDIALNNNHTSRLARLVMDSEPALAGFFATRRLRGY